MLQQIEIKLKPRTRGYHLITDEVLNKLKTINDVKIGILNLFIKHTSASLAINENADPTVRSDLETHINKMIPDGMKYYQHDYEGDDDMPAHIKATLIGPSISIPISDGRLNMGVWQGIYLCEHRLNGGSRSVILTLQY